MKQKTKRPEKKFNGKPISHWNAMADELVIDLIVRAAFQTDIRSVVGARAQARLLSIAELENPVLYEKVLKERSRSVTGMANLLSRILGPTKSSLKGVRNV